MTSGYICRYFERMLEDGHQQWNDKDTNEILEEVCDEFHATRTIYLDRFGEEIDSDPEISVITCSNHEENGRFAHNMEERAATLLNINMRLCPDCDTWWSAPTDWIDHLTDYHDGVEPTFIGLTAPPNPAHTNEYTDRAGNIHRYDRDRGIWREVPTPREPVRRLTDAFQPYAAYEEPF